jgi:hypothetical protein
MCKIVNNEFFPLHKFYSYYVMCLDFETFYPTNPQKPLWVKVYHEELNKLKPKKLPMSDIHLHEQFKKYFGYKKAIKCKVFPFLCAKLLSSQHIDLPLSVFPAVWMSHCPFKDNNILTVVIHGLWIHS